MFGRGTNDRRITEFVQRFDAIDERIAAIDGRLLLALQVAAGSSEAVKATSLQLAALREDGQPPASSARTDGAAIGVGALARPRLRPRRGLAALLAPPCRTRGPARRAAPMAPRTSR